MGKAWFDVHSPQPKEAVSLIRFAKNDCRLRECRSLGEILGESFWKNGSRATSEAIYVRESLTTSTSFGQRIPWAAALLCWVFMADESDELRIQMDGNA
jgi:hypothetical protein